MRPYAGICARYRGVRRTPIVRIFLRPQKIKYSYGKTSRMSSIRELMFS